MVRVGILEGAGENVGSHDVGIQNSAAADLQTMLISFSGYHDAKKKKKQ